MRHYNPLRMLLTPVNLTLSLVTSALAEIATDLLLVPVFDGDSLDDIPGLDAAAGGHISRAMTSGEFTGRPFEIYLTPLTGWKTARVGLVGAGKREDFTTERMRRVATAAALAARQRRVTRIAWLVRGDIPAPAAVQASVEGVGLSAFSIDSYKSGERGGPPVGTIAIAVPGGRKSELEPYFERGRILSESCNITRELCNEPPNVLTPRELGERAVALGRDAGFHVEVLDEKELGRLGMGLLLGVGQGSPQPP